MDNLTHSFAGALLAQMGLKKLTARATATLVIAANIPDIDAVATVFGTESLAMRRGLTHGPIALALLPLILTALVLAWNRWRPAKEPVRFWPLLLCAYIGTLSHPALDWLNSYGVRLLEPFSSTWYAGDTLFIIDLWIWITLVGCWWWSRRAEKRGGDWQRPAWIGFAVIGAYIFGNGWITGRAEAGYRAAAGLPTSAEVVANPVPAIFWQRSILWRDDRQQVYGPHSSDGTIDWSVFGPINVSASIDETRLDHPALAAARGRPDVEAFLFWSRMPIVIERDGVTYLADQRFNSELTRGQFLVPLTSRP
ncbi:metal-dependent hydrolase [Sphingomonas sp. LHG3406-1]|uniref:metal-dependent hydrolase n=1 Tax=Sphingomonas sp. LHG3406-1 TaxID=2804617 RepID=UPI002612F133|nr:metal-dependent hydrolase [Sphingomonas sp. LHG3406-1]